MKIVVKSPYKTNFFMQNVLVVIQIFLILAIIIIVFMQRSSSDGTANLAGGGNNLMSDQASTNFLSKMTMILAILFMLNSILLARISYQKGDSSQVLLKEIEKEEDNPPRLN